MISLLSVYVCLCVCVCVLLGHLLYMLLIQLGLFVIPRARNRKHNLSYINKLQMFAFSCNTLMVTLYSDNDKMLDNILNIS